MPLRQIRRVGGDLIGNQPLLNVLFIWQAEMLFGRNVAEHGAAEPADHRGADTGGEVIVTGRDIGGQRAERIERGFVTVLQLLGHIAADHLHGNMAGTFDHHLHVILPGDLRQLAQRAQLGELRLVVGVLN